MAWSSRLLHPIALADGRILRKLRDVGQFLLSLPEKDQRHVEWHRLTDLLMTAERTGNAALIAVLTGQIEEALWRPPFTTARLADDDAKKPRRRACDVERLESVGQMEIEFHDGRELSDDELDRIRRELEAFDRIDAISDELRAIVVRN